MEQRHDDDPATAKTFAMHLLDRANLLSEFPELGTPYRKRRDGSTAFTSNIKHLTSNIAASAASNSAFIASFKMSILQARVI